jgi:transcriptional regulator GlxA family with amidase domain
MNAHPTFGRYAENAVEKLCAEQWQAHECTMCQGTGRRLRLVPNLSRERQENTRHPTPDSRSPPDSIVVSVPSYGKSSSRPGFPQYIIRRIEELVAKHLEGGVSVAELASSQGYSPSHFCRMFRGSFGVPPHTYLIRRRVAVAQQLLTRTDLALADIALKTGFSDQSHLSRSFRRFAGIAPRAYRALTRTFADGGATAASTV